MSGMESRIEAPWRIIRKAISTDVQRFCWMAISMDRELLVRATFVFVRQIDAPAPPMFYCRESWLCPLKNPGQKFKLEVKPIWMASSTRKFTMKRQIVRLSDQPVTAVTFPLHHVLRYETVTSGTGQYSLVQVLYIENTKLLSCLMMILQPPPLLHSRSPS